MSAIYLISTTGVLTGPVTFPVVPGVGVQIPENTLQLADELPECPEGFAWGLVNDTPEQLPDHRGMVYSIETGAPQEWSVLGALPEGFTNIPYPGQFYVWRAGDWQFDVDAQTAAKAVELLEDRDSRLRTSQMRIAPLQYAGEIGEATEQEKAALEAWKRYSVALNRIEQQEGFPHSVNWPPAPVDAQDR